MRHINDDSNYNNVETNNNTVCSRNLTFKEVIEVIAGILLGIAVFSLYLWGLAETAQLSGNITVIVGSWLYLIISAFLGVKILRKGRKYIGIGYFVIIVPVISILLLSGTCMLMNL